MFNAILASLGVIGANTALVYALHRKHVAQVEAIRQMEAELPPAGAQPPPG